MNYFFIVNLFDFQTTFRSMPVFNVYGLPDVFMKLNN